MKQTAVDWFYDKVIQKQYKDIDDSLEDLLEQAKEMEKQQMKLACIRTEYEDKAWQNLMEKQFEQYYNETFK
jgi:uncharacterized metal-binding protein